MKVPVIFNMATMPSRVRPLQDTINSLLPQADEINIYLNGYQTPTPTFLNHPKIKVYRSETEACNIGDVGKFYTCETWKNCYAFTVDDKYIYPPDYAQRLIETIERYGRKAVVSCHGRTIKPNCTSYYNEPETMFCLGGEVAEDTFAHELGTGCMALHTDTFKFTLDIFTHTNMSDVLASISLQKANVPILIMGHKYQWVRTSPKCDQVYSIHNFLNKADQFVTNIVNAFTWKINTCPTVS